MHFMDIYEPIKGSFFDVTRIPVEKNSQTCQSYENIKKTFMTNSEHLNVQNLRIVAVKGAFIPRVNWIIMLKEFMTRVVRMHAVYVQRPFTRGVI